MGKEFFFRKLVHVVTLTMSVEVWLVFLMSQPAFQIWGEDAVGHITHHLCMLLLIDSRNKSGVQTLGA